MAEYKLPGNDVIIRSGNNLRPPERPTYELPPGDAIIGRGATGVWGRGATGSWTNDPRETSLILDHTEQWQKNVKQAEGFWENVWAGKQSSLTNMMATGLPDTLPTSPDQATFSEKAGGLVGEVVGVGMDVPFFMAGGAAAGAAVTATTKHPAAGVAATVAGGYASFALHAALRSMYMDMLISGETPSASSFWDRLPEHLAQAHEAGKLGLLISATMGAAKVGMLMRGGLSGPKATIAGMGYKGKGLERLTDAERKVAVEVMGSNATRAAVLGAEFGAFALGPAALEGRGLPDSWEEVAHSAAFLVGLKAGHKGLSVGRKMVGKVVDVYKETGVLPRDLVNDTRVDPTILLDMDVRPIGERTTDQQAVLRAIEYAEAAKIPQDQLNERQRQLIEEGPIRLDNESSTIAARAVEIANKPLEERTLKEAEFLERMTTEDPYAERVRLTPEERDTVHQTLVKELGRLGRKDLAVQLVDKIRNGTMDAAYERAVISMALDTPVGQRLGVLNHEFIHAIRDLGLFTPAEWKILERKAKRWAKDPNLRGDGFTTEQRYKDQGLTPDGVLEEAIADASRALQEGRIRDPDGFLAGTMSKVRDFLEATANAFRMNGFRTAKDVLRDVQSGEIGSRQWEGQFHTAEARRLERERMALEGVSEPGW